MHRLGAHHQSHSHVQTVPGSSISGFFQGALRPCLRQRTARTQSRASNIVIEARYRGKNTDLTKVPDFMRHETDTGSAEVQIALLSARVTQLTAHLKENRKDYASRRGLDIILSKRRHFMQYLYKHDRTKYETVIRKLNIRPLRIQAGQNVVVRATEEGIVVIDQESTLPDEEVKEEATAEAA